MRKKAFKKSKENSFKTLKYFMIQFFLAAIALTGIVTSVPILLNILFSTVT